MNMEFSNGAHWYAVYVRSRHEFKIFNRLTESGIETFLPVVERLSRWKDRKKLVSFPLFAGYLFVHISKDYNDILSVLKTHGVVRFLGIVPGEPEPVPDEQIAYLKKLVESRFIITKSVTNKNDKLTLLHRLAFLFMIHF